MAMRRNPGRECGAGEGECSAVPGFVIGTSFDILQTQVTAGVDSDGEPWDYARMRAAVAFAREQRRGGWCWRRIGRSRETTRSARRCAAG